MYRCLFILLLVQTSDAIRKSSHESTAQVAESGKILLASTGNESTAQDTATGQAESLGELDEDVLGGHLGESEVDGMSDADEQLLAGSLSDAEGEVEAEHSSNQTASEEEGASDDDEEYLSGFSTVLYDQSSDFANKQQKQLGRLAPEQKLASLGTTVEANSRIFVKVEVISGSKFKHVIGYVDEATVKKVVKKKAVVVTRMSGAAAKKCGPAALKVCEDSKDGYCQTWCDSYCWDERECSKCKADCTEKTCKAALKNILGTFKSQRDIERGLGMTLSQIKSGEYHELESMIRDHVFKCICVNWIGGEKKNTKVCHIGGQGIDDSHKCVSDRKKCKLWCQFDDTPSWRIVKNNYKQKKNVKQTPLIPASLCNTADIRGVKGTGWR